MGVIIHFDEAARRARERRASSLGPADWFWLSAVVFWPVSLVLFTAQALLDAALPPSRRGR